MRGLTEQSLEQIRDRDYIHGLRGRTLLYGVAFDGKRPTIVSDSVVLRCGTFVFRARIQRARMRWTYHPIY